MQTASLPGTRASSKADKLLYHPLDFVVVRAPLLPVESYCSLSDEDDLLSRFVDPHIQRALAVGSSSLLATLERFKHKGLSPRDTELMRAKLLRYLIRMSTRPTPFGLFAGVTLASWGAVTDLSVKSTCAATRTRPDMAWLLAFVASIEANPAVLTRLNNFLTAASAWDRMQPEESLEAFGDLLAQAGVSPDKSRDTPIQVDMTMSVEGRLGNAISVEAARAAELLLRLTPMPTGLSALASYRQNFL